MYSMINSRKVSSGSSLSSKNNPAMIEVPTQKFRVEKRRPDGGWGYCIMFGLVLLLTCAWGSQGTFSFVFTDFLVKTGREGSVLALIKGCYSGSMSFAGLLSTVLLKKYSLRSVGVFGSMLFCVASTLLVFVNTIEGLLIAFGIIQAFGYGLMVPVVYTTFNEYFVQKRALMMNISKAIVGVGTMCYPLLVEFLIRKLVFRNALAVLAAINSSVIVSMWLMHPVEWHMRDVIVTIEETNASIDQNVEDRTVPRGESVNDELLTGTVENIPSNQNNQHDHNRSKWQKIVDYLDLNLLKDSIYVNIVLGITFASISIDTFSSLRPMYLAELGYSKIDTALIMSIGNAADVVSPVFLSILAWCIDIKARYIFLTGAIATIGLRFVFVNIIDFTGMAVIIALMYAFQSLMTSPLQLVFGDHLPQERFATGFGLYQFLKGNLTFFIQPIAGLIRDVTRSYIICFHSLTILLCLCVLPWTIEIIYGIYSRKKVKNHVTSQA